MLKANENEIADNPIKSSHEYYSETNKYLHMNTSTIKSRVNTYDNAFFYPYYPLQQTNYKNVSQ